MQFETTLFKYDAQHKSRRCINLKTGSSFLYFWLTFFWCEQIKDKSFQ